MPRPEHEQSHAKDGFSRKAYVSVWLLKPAVQIGLILLVGLILYLPTLHAPFIFDDFPCIRNNPAIRSFGYFFDYERVRALNISNDIKNNFALRPVGYLTFALNYAAGGLNTFGFHLANTVIHLANAVLVFLFAAFTLQRAPLRASGREALPLIALLPLLIALLFVVHPLQTQAVTYITQRFTSLATLFYFAALLFFIRARTAQRSLARKSCYVLALLVTVLAMKTKAIAFTLPVSMLLYDLFFLPGKTRQRLLWLFPFFLSLVIIPGTLIWLVATDGVDDPRWKIDQSLNLVNFAQVSRWDYLKTQFGVIITYLRMLFVPVGQNLDHDYRLAQSFFEPKILGSFLLLLSLFGGAIALALRSFKARERSAERIIAFGILWFFITIAMSSSIIPLDDLLVEYRVYLPSFGFFFALVVAVAMAVTKGILSFRHFIGGTVVVIVLFASATIARNSLYREQIALYRDTVAKSPDKPRAHSLLGVAYLVGDRPDEAMTEFTRVLQLRPEDAYTMVNIGNVFFDKGEFAAAIQQFQRSLEFVPGNYLAHGNLGLCYLNIGRMDEAEQELQKALAINANFKEGRSSLAHLYEILGRNDEAVMHYRKLLEFFPKDHDARERLNSLTGRHNRGEEPAEPRH